MTRGRGLSLPYLRVSAPAALVQISTLPRDCSVISNCTGFCVFCCMKVTRGVTREPTQKSRTRSFVRSHVLSLLSIARLNVARSRDLGSSRIRPTSAHRRAMENVSTSINNGKGRQHSTKQFSMDVLPANPLTGDIYRETGEYRVKHNQLALRTACRN